MLCKYCVIVIRVLVLVVVVVVVIIVVVVATVVVVVAVVFAPFSCVPKSFRVSALACYAPYKRTGNLPVRTVPLKSHHGR